MTLFEQCLSNCDPNVRKEVDRNINLTIEGKMINLTLKRIALKDTYTIGRLYVDGKYFCDTIEDKVRVLNSAKDKVYGETAIPYGTYEVKLTYSNKHRKVMPQIMSVPYFEGIRIHSGNTANDSLGCVIVGENKVKGKVINSRITYNRLMEKLNDKETIMITIE